MLLKVVEFNGTHMDVDMLLDTRKGEFHTGLAASFFVTAMSELGDKTFIMSAILAMHHSRTLTFLGSVLAQIIMTGVAVGLGMAVSLIPEVYTRWASCICMTFFGLKMLKDGFNMSTEDESQNLTGPDANIIEQFDKSGKISEEEILNKQNGTVQSSGISTTGSRKKRDSKPSSEKVRNNFRFPQECLSF